jgi:two-component system OmpR family response regulator
MYRVLYVDDEPDIREIAMLSLGLDQTLDVRGCASGPEALATIEGWQPHLMLLDVMMPGMDGPTTLAKLRENSAWSEIAVVFITARTQASEVERFLQLGAVGVIAKPFDPMTLAKATRGFLEKS